jgi:hypothetical protein
MGSAEDLKAMAKLGRAERLLVARRQTGHIPAERRLSLKPGVVGPEPRRRAPRMPVEPRYDLAETNETWVDEGDGRPHAQPLILAGDSYILVP